MTTKTFPIKTDGAITQQTPIVGRWYCGFTFGIAAYPQDLDGDLAQWDGEEFNDDGGELYMGDYDYLVLQA